MSEAGVAGQKVITELKVSGHLMTLESGTYCVFYAPGTQPPDPANGLPGVRLSPAPTARAESLTITGFRPDGFLGSNDAAALIRVTAGPAQVLVTIYQSVDGRREAPKLQVLRLTEPGVAPLPAVAPPPPSTGPTPTSAAIASVPAQEAEVAAHVQGAGDVLRKLGEWMGEKGSRRWVEGFAIAPRAGIKPADIEYQAVLGKGWLSPWSEGGQYCGSRGMALPILGLRVRLKGEAASSHIVAVSATFVDGTQTGPMTNGEVCEAASLAPLEAFQVVVRAAEAAAAGVRGGAARPAAKAAAPASPETSAAKRPGRPGAKPSPLPGAMSRTTAKGKPARR